MTLCGIRFGHGRTLLLRTLGTREARGACPRTLLVLKAGSTTPAGTGDAKPTGDKPTGKPQSDMKPQGGSEQLPVTGSLAHTGSSSALPAIGLIGGAAVVAGAGAMFVVRRRKGAGTNAAA